MIKVVYLDQAEAWEKFVLSYKAGNFLHSWAWGEMNKNLGFKIFRLGFIRDNELQGVCFLIKKKAKRGIYLECPGGPLLNWQNKNLIGEFVNHIKKIAVMENCLFIRVRPQLEDSLENNLLFKKYGFNHAPTHLHAENTWQIDLTKSENELLAEMRKTTRYLIRKAANVGVKIVLSTDEKDVDILYQQQIELAKKQKFTPFSRNFFKEEFKAFSATGNLEIFKAIYQDKILAIAFIIFYHKEAVYHYSASKDYFPHIPASYALQWAVIKEAKKRGCLTYNLWGIAPTDNISHRFAGVSLFKKGFGGFAYNYLKARDLPISIKYWLVYIFEYLRNKYRRL